MKDLERVEFHLRALVGGIWRLTRIHDLLVIQPDASRIQQFLQKNIKKPLRIGILLLEKTEQIDFVTLCYEDDHIFPDVGPALRFLRR